MGSRDYFKLGEWNAICPVCGFKRKSGEMKLRWDGQYVCKEDWEPRHPQDFVRARDPEHPLPWTRPDSDPIYVDTTVTRDKL